MVKTNRGKIAGVLGALALGTGLFLMTPNKADAQTSTYGISVSGSSLSVGSSGSFSVSLNTSLTSVYQGSYRLAIFDSSDTGFSTPLNFSSVLNVTGSSLGSFWNGTTMDIGSSSTRFYGFSSSNSNNPLNNDFVTQSGSPSTPSSGVFANYSATFQQVGNYTIVMTSGNINLTTNGVYIDGNSINAQYSFGVAAVPEPSTYGAIMGVAALALAAYKRKKNEVKAYVKREMNREDYIPTFRKAGNAVMGVFTRAKGSELEEKIAA